MTVTDLISFALLACASWRLVDATRTLRRVEAMHADADRRLNAAAEYAEQVHRNAAHLARIMHPSTQPAITADSDGRLTVDWPDPDIDHAPGKAEPLNA